jgi:tumor protein p53-inducible protein 3
LLGTDGRWISYGLLSGAKTQLNMAVLLGKRISLITTTLKTRSDAYKTDLLADFQKTALSSFDSGVLRPIIYKTYRCDW